MYFDIGANVGNWAIANLIYNKKIICLEASPTTFGSLAKNSNNCPDIVCLNYAVCDNNLEDITFYQAYCDTVSTINKDWLTNEKMRFCNFPYKEIVCKTITLDKLIENYGVPELIKIDVEGGEYECIKSLTQKVKLLCFEWASETNDITLKCLEYLHNTLKFTEFFMQFEDNYIFRPTNYYDINTLKNKLANTIPKHDWGMIWCR